MPKKVKQLGDFKLMKKLGEGGMGDVYLARQISLDRLVALKILSKKLLSGQDPDKRKDFITRFKREARTMAKLDHANAVKVYAVDEAMGLHFLAIEYIDGRSIQDWLDKNKKLSIGDSVHIALCCAEAMTQAHEVGLVHRDIKPDNILVTKKGVIKVADFGLAKALEEDVSVTQSGSGLGTPLYMAPEQARDAKHVDHRADVYALGATLYHMISGALPFGGDSALELILAKEKGKFTPVRQVEPKCPEKLGLMIDRMMAKDPAHRYQSCAEIVADLSSLNVASPALTFIDGAQPALRTVAPSAPTMAGNVASTNANVTSVADVNSRKDAKRGSAKEKAKKDRTWYIRHKNAKKKTVVSRMTTRQAVQAIRSEVLDPTCEAKTDVNDDFRLMAEMPEFAAAMEKRMVRVKAKVKANDMKTLYAQAEKAEKRRHSKRFFRNMFEGTVGYASLLIWLVIVAAVIYGGYLAIQFLPNIVAEKLGIG